MSTALRNRILELAHNSVAAAYGPDGLGTFRNMRMGPYVDSLPAPACTLTDAGTEQFVDPVDQVVGKTLRIAITLDLPDQWDRQNGGAAWAEVVEAIEGLLASLPDDDEGALLGLIMVSVVRDEPLEVLMDSGGSSHIWAMDVEARYYATRVVE